MNWTFRGLGIDRQAGVGNNLIGTSLFAETYCELWVPGRDLFGGLTRHLNRSIEGKGRSNGSRVVGCPVWRPCVAHPAERGQQTPRLCVGYLDLLLSMGALTVAGYVLEIIGQLSRQLLLSPARLRIQQIAGAEHLLHLLDPARSYPYDLVLFHVTNYRRARARQDDGLLEGSPLITDLVQLVDDLSASADLRASQLDQPCLTVEQLVARFRISPKTVNRWRRRGLVSYRAITDDGRRRIVFPDRAIRRFVGKNTTLVKRASSFSKLTAAERGVIVDKARGFVDAGTTKVTDVVERVAAEVGRSVETVRYILRRFDQEHPNDRLFDRKPKVLGPEDHMRIYRCYRSGDTVQDLAARFGRTASNIYRIIQEIRYKDLLSQDIEYVHSDEFDLPDADAVILDEGDAKPSSAKKRGRRTRRPTGDLPAYLKALYDQPLLEREQEWNGFRRYNYLKFKAKRLIESFGSRKPTSRELKELEGLFDLGEKSKNALIQANLRLVVSIAKKHVRGGADLFSLVSDGNLSLMKAVEKFDYSRGNRFSTYATWAIMKNYARSIPDERTQKARYQTGNDERLGIEPDPVDFTIRSDRGMEGIREALEGVLHTLPARERAIVTRHFGLTKDGKRHTLDQIGRLFGVSKERARQLEKRALRKLREIVSPTMLEAVLD